MLLLRRIYFIKPILAYSVFDITLMYIWAMVAVIHVLALPGLAVKIDLIKNWGNKNHLKGSQVEKLEPAEILISLTLMLSGP